MAQQERLLAQHPVGHAASLPGAGAWFAAFRTEISVRASYTMTLDEFFAGHADSWQLFEVLRSAIEDLGPVEMRITKSEVAFCRKKAFAWAWTPGRYLHGKHALLVLTLGFRQRDASPRWKEIVEPKPGRFTHHLELHSTTDIDDEVRTWLQAAWAAAD